MLAKMMEKKSGGDQAPQVDAETIARARNNLEAQGQVMRAQLQSQFASPSAVTPASDVAPATAEPMPAYQPPQPPPKPLMSDKDAAALSAYGEGMRRQIQAQTQAPSPLAGGMGGAALEQEGVGMGRQIAAQTSAPSPLAKALEDDPYRARPTHDDYTNAMASYDPRLGF